MRPLPLAAALLLAAAAAAGCTARKDEDGDGLYDDVERRGWDITVDLVLKRATRHVTSDIHKEDSDGDGFSDFAEFQAGLDPRAADTDGDGLTDCQEELHSVAAQCQDPAFHGPFDGGTGTLPANADSDRGVGRYVAARFSDPTGTLTSAVAWGDGLADGAELAGFDVALPGGGTRHVATDPTMADSDGDALEDGEEILLFHTDPDNPDTDGDGCADGFDPVPDREERYRIGLREFLLKRSQDTLAGADLQLDLVMAGNSFLSPPASGTPVAVGERTSIEALDPGDLRPLDPCAPGTTRPWLTTVAPWIYIGVAARDVDGSTATVLDIHTLTRPGAASFTAEVYWNPQTDRFSWSIDGRQPFAGPLRLSGADGELTLQPRVL